MGIRRTKHAVYDIKYHLVWIPKYRKHIMKSVSAREVFRKFPKLREQLWAGEFWNDGYLVRSVGDKVTSDIIKRYIEYRTHEADSIQLSML